MTGDSAKPATTIVRLVRWVVEQRAAGVPDAHVRQATLLALDTIGCGIAGWQEATARDVVAHVESAGGAPQAQVIGSALRTSLAQAVLANGTLVRVLDLNDYVIGNAAAGGDMGGHPSDNIPVAIAAGEVGGSSGREVLAAIVLGYELYGRLKRLMDRHSDWDGVTVSGAVAAAITGQLIGLDATAMAHAIGLALARSATPAAVRSGDISAAKSIANALIAQTGVQAALLAQRGVTGPLCLLDQKRGLQSVFPRQTELARLYDPIGADAVILGAHVKAYPCLATGQSIVAAALAMHRALGADTNAIAHVRLVLADYPTIVRQQTDPGRIDPRSREAADHSFPFLAAVALLDGAFGLPQFDGERWHDPAVRAVMARIEIANDPGWAARAPDGYPCRIEVRLTDGTTRSIECVDPPGFSRGGIDADAVVAKFNAVTADRLSGAECQALIDAVMTLDAAPDCTALARAMATAGAARRNMGSDPWV